MKNFWKKFLTLSMVVATITTCTVGLTACNNKGNGNNTTKVNPVEDSSFVNLDINPNIDLVVDKNGTVLSVVANNDDAEKLLLSVDAKTNKTYAEGVTGKSVSIAVDTIIDASVELEYINDTNKDVKVLAIKADGSLNQELINSAKATIETAVENAKQAGALAANYAIDVVTKVTNSLNVRLANAKEKLAEVDAAAADALTAGKLLLMETIEELTAGAVAFEESVKLSVAELNQYIYDLSQQVTVVAKGAVEQIQKEAILIAQQAEEELNKLYKKAKPGIDAGKFIAAKSLKEAFVSLQAGYVDFINKANTASLNAIAAMKIAPNTKRGQDELNDDVVEVANSLFTEQALKDDFYVKAKDANENRYTYKSVAKAIENEIDSMEMDGTTDNANIAKAKYNKINNKVNGFVVDNQEEFVQAQQLAKKAIDAAQKGMGFAMKGYVALVAEFNEYIDAPAPEAAPDAFTTYTQLLSYVSDLLTTQNANIEKAFITWSKDYVTDDVKAQLDTWQTKMEQAKQKAIEAYEESILAE